MPQLNFLFIVQKANRKGYIETHLRTFMTLSYCLFETVAIGSNWSGNTYEHILCTMT